ncbi:MAG: SMC family ATPase [Candidatus Thermoplasmatota archaeon]|nr:SMC family ATPase [Candidatus Thermoplasmatota archaeon]
MKLHSLVLHNYRKFKHAEIEFPDGITGIIGNNGSGKSTLIEAVGWAIYGNKVARTNKENIKRQNANPSEECWVKLTFEIGRDVYEVTRIMGGSSLLTDANVKINGLVAASSATGVTQLLEKKIGMDYDAFFTSLVARQKEINALSSKTPGERKRSMLRMLKIDAIEDAVRKVREDKKEKENVVEGMRSALKDIDGLKEGMNEGKAKKEELSSRLHDVESAISSLESKARGLEVRRDRERKKFERYNGLEKERELLDERIKSKERQMEEKEKEKNELKEKKSRYGQIEPLEKEYDNVKKEKERMEKVRDRYLSLKKLKEDMVNLQSEVKKLDDTIAELEEKLKERKKIADEHESLKAQEKALAEKKRETESSIKIKNVQIKASNERMEESEKERKKIAERGPESSCPTCGRLLKDRYEKILENFAKKVEIEKKKIEEFMAERNSLENKIVETDAEKEALKEKTEEVEKLMDETKKMEQKLIYVVENKKEKEKKIEDNKNKIDGMGEIEFDEKAYEEHGKKVGKLLPIKEEIIVLRSEIKKLPDVEKHISQLREDIDVLDKRRSDIYHEIEELDFDKQKYEIIEKKYEEKRNELQKMREERIHIAGKIGQINSELERIAREINEQKEMENKIKELRKEIQQLDMLAGDRDTGLLNDFRRYLISKIGPTLSYYASNFFNVFTAGKYSQIEVDDNYDIYIYDDGEKFGVNRFSGGEEDLANLSLRLAISQVIAQRSGNLEFNFIVLDEIFGSQDNERRTNVLSTLGELSHQFQQVILITHIEEIKDAMQYVIRTFEDEEGVSHIRIE